MCHHSRTQVSKRFKKNSLRERNDAGFDMSTPEQLAEAISHGFSIRGTSTYLCRSEIFPSPTLCLPSFATLITTDPLSDIGSKLVLDHANSSTQVSAEYYVFFRVTSFELPPGRTIFLVHADE